MNKKKKQKKKVSQIKNFKKHEEGQIGGKKARSANRIEAEVKRQKASGTVNEHRTENS